jgi:hypothetical protein
MWEQSDTQIVLTENINASPSVVFQILADPHRQVEIDGSGMLVAAPGTEPIAAVGDVFRMKMSQPAFGEYETENHVVDFERDRVIAWMPAGAGLEPSGVKWSWAIEPAGEGCLVTHTYDWSGLTDPAILAYINPPRVQPEQLQQTMDRLASAATK